MDLAGWTPIYTYFAAGNPMLDWCRTGTRRFTEPFFGDTIDQVHRDPALLLFRRQTTLDEAGEWLRLHPGLPPSGFLFHMSRCGSTLAARMLGAIPANRVLSEPPALNGVLRAALLDPTGARETHRRRLRTVVDLLGLPLPGETRYFLKLDCWHVLALPLFVEAFPGVPWIFLHRDPAEVLVSQVRSPGAWSVPGALPPEVFGINGAEPVPRHEYLARALARLCDAAHRYRGMGRGLLVSYGQLPEFACGPLLRHFDLPFTPEEVDAMRAAALTDAKSPTLPFSSDRASKRQAMTPALQSLVERWLSPACAPL
jgi:hypothetical protein